MGMMYIISKCNVKIDVFSHVDHIPVMAMAISSDRELKKKKVEFPRWCRLITFMILWIFSHKQADVGAILLNNF